MANAKADESGVKPRRNPRDVVRDYLRFLEAHDMDALDEVVANDIIIYRPNGEVAFSDRDAWKQAVENEPFADSKIEIEDIVCDKDKIAVRYRLECTQVGPVLGVAPSNRRLSTSGTKIYRVLDGRIIEIAGHDDFLSVLRQLGVVELDL